MQSYRIRRALFASPAGCVFLVVGIAMFLAMAASFAKAETVRCLLPPPKYDHDPIIPVDRVYLSETDTDYECKFHLSTSQVFTACTWWDNDRHVHQRIAIRSPARTGCWTRHENGHLNQAIEMGNSNPDHVGWTQRDVTVPDVAKAESGPK